MKTKQRSLLLVSFIMLCSIILWSASTDAPVDLKFTALDGRKVDLKDLRGQFVLIDCWATWCSSCLKEMPHVKALYEKYHDRGFEVIGISMDESGAKERVLQLIKKNDIPWPQRFEGRGFQEDSFRTQYQIQALPAVFLLDREGRIIEKDARGERLEAMLQQYLN